MNTNLSKRSWLYNQADFYSPMDQLKTDCLYWIVARNSHLGIWFEPIRGFVIPRKKFNLTFLDIEYHWDTHDEKKFPHGTAKPFKLIEKAPFPIKDVFDKKCKYLEIPDEKLGVAVLSYLLAKSAEISEEALLSKIPDRP